MKITVRVEQPFTQVPNLLINDPEVSFGACGLYTYLASKPGVWDFSATRIAKDKVKHGRDSILKLLNELEEQGYLLRERQSDGRMNYTLLWEKQTEFVEAKDQNSGLQEVVVSGVDKPKKQISLEEQTKKDITSAVMREFLLINKAMQGMMAWKHERDAAFSLAQVIGIENIKSYISFVPKLKEHFDERFVPDCTKPSSMLRNFAKFEEVYKKNLKSKDTNGYYFND